MFLKWSEYAGKMVRLLDSLKMPHKRSLWAILGRHGAQRRPVYSSASGININDVFVPGSAGATNIQWNGSGFNSTKVSPEMGGVSYAAGAAICDNSSSLFGDHIVFNFRGLRNGHDGVAGYKGPYRSLFADSADVRQGHSDGSVLKSNGSICPELRMVAA